MSYNEVPLWITLTSTGTLTVHPPVDAKLGTYTIIVNLTLQDFGNADISKGTAVKVNIIKNNRAWLITLIGSLATALITIVISVVLYYILTKIVKRIRVKRIQ
jgi:hypothetical protein